MMIYTLEEAAANHLGSEKESQLQADISVRFDNIEPSSIVIK